MGWHSEAGGRGWWDAGWWVPGQEAAGLHLACLCLAYIYLTTPVRHPLLAQVYDYLEIHQRVQLLNDRFSVMQVRLWGLGQGGCRQAGCSACAGRWASG